MPITHLYFVASAFLLGLGAVLSKLILSLSADGVTPPAPLVVLCLQVLGGVGFLIVVRLMGGIKTEGLAQLKLPALAGLVLGVGSIGTILAIALITASEASLVFATQPIFVLLLAWALLGERVGWSVVLLCLLAVFGVGLIVVSGPSTATSGRLVGLACAILSITCAALYTVWMRKLSTDTDLLTALLVVQTVSLCVAVVSLMTAHLFFRAPMSAGGLNVAVMTLGSGAAYYGAAYYLYVLGLKSTPASTAGIYLCLVPVFALGLAYALLSETLLPLQWAGAFIVIAAVSAVFVLSNQRAVNTQATE